MKPELLITLIDIKDLLTLSGNNVDGQPDNDQGGLDADWL